MCYDFYCLCFLIFISPLFLSDIEAIGVCLLVQFLTVSLSYFGWYCEICLLKSSPTIYPQIILFIVFILYIPDKNIQFNISFRVIAIFFFFNMAMVLSFSSGDFIRQESKRLKLPNCKNCKNFLFFSFQEHSQSLYSAIENFGLFLCNSLFAF